MASLLASLKVMLGIDTVDYESKMRGATTLAGQFEKDLSRAGQRMGSSLTGPLVLAGVAAEKFGGQLTSTFMDAAGVTSKLQVQTNGLMMATGRLADSALLAVAAYGKLSNVSVSAKTLNTAIVGLSVAAGEAGWAVGRLIAEVTGLDDALRDKAGKPANEIAEALAKDETRFQNVVQQVTHLKERLGLLGPEWEISNVRTKENALQLSNVNEKILVLIKSQRTITDVVRDYIGAQEALKNIHEANVRVLERVKQASYDAYSVMTRADVTTGFEKIAADVGMMAERGVSWQQVMTAVAPKFKELSDAAATYTNFNMPQQARDLATAFSDETGVALDSYLRSVATIPDATKKASADNAMALAELGDKFKDGVKGGFATGAQEGIAEIKRIVTDEAGTIKMIIPVEFAHDGLQKLVNDMLAGRNPDTMGGVHGG